MNNTNTRITAFLLGFIVALSVLYTGLELTTSPADTSESDDMLDDIAKDMISMPPPIQKDMISAGQASQPLAKAITPKVRGVDKMLQDINKISPNSDENSTMNGDGSMNINEKGAVEESNVTTALPQITGDDNPPLRIVEKLPEFPGGMVELMKWLTKNLKYPVLAQKQKLQGRVLVSFIINKDGSISDIKVAQGIDPLLDREALRVVRMMPRWKPGIEMGKPCRTMFAIPVVFQL